MGNPRLPSSSRWVVRFIAATMLVCVFVYLPYHLYQFSGYAKYLDLRADLDALEVENAGLRAEVERLLGQAEALREDPHAIEQVARHEFGWVRPGDLLIDFGDARP